jgi:malonyl-CoA/methylmalonyl-CoA synthetase
MTGNFFECLRGGFPADRGKAFFLLPDGTAISYGAVEAKTGQLAQLLVDRGVVPGDRIVVQAVKSPEMILLYFAALQAGAVFVPLNTAYTASEIDYFVNDAEPRLFVDDPVALMAEAEKLPAMAGSIPVMSDDLAAIVYTSGTTGRSKGAMLSHGNLAANAVALHAAWGFTPDDVLLHALPIFHIHGLFIALHCALLSGAPMLWLPRYDDAAVLAALPRTTVMMGVPTFYTRLLARPDFTRAAAAHMRLFISGSAPLLASTFEAFEARTGQRILERYGMSEAIIITTNPLEGERKAGSVGFPLPGVRLRIAGKNENGPIEIRGPSVLTGYWRAPDKTAESFTADGYFITGDVGRLGEDGRLWISGREKDLIISGGLNIYPREIESRLDECEGITESAVIGVPHPDLGEGVVAVAIGAGDEARILAGLRAELAGFKTPKRLFFVEDFPRNAMGKIQKNVLRSMYEDVFSET